MQYRVTYSEDYLEHHGILGQKWGVRRFQNSDGTLTAEGKIRYLTDTKEDLKKANTQSIAGGLAFLGGFGVGVTALGASFLTANPALLALSVAGFTGSVAGVVASTKGTKFVDEHEYIKAIGDYEKSGDVKELTDSLDKYYQRLIKRERTLNM